MNGIAGQPVAGAKGGDHFSQDQFLVLLLLPMIIGELSV